MSQIRNVVLIVLRRRRWHTKFGAKSVSETSLPVVKEQVEKLRGLLADLRSSVGKASAWIDLAQESAAALADDDDGLEYVDP
ncbi:hypothetical protein CC2G_015212 [Coprinopsis cinerea AmutBmut pab1-1]|nr:hypothetical protein CC2G_015212 [Coprinopsis cinerea AmutBmut pab1-1]